MSGPLNDIITDIPNHQISFDVPAFDEAIASQGVRLVHYRAMRCPVGMVDIDDNRRPHLDHSGCTNGFIYTKVGTVLALFTSNSKQRKPEEVGFYDSASVQVTFRRFYEEPADEEVFIAPFDRFYLDEESIVVPNWEIRLDHESGYVRLKYPATKVQDVMDASGERYYQGSDFSLDNGQIVWGNRRPAPQMQVGGDTPSTRAAVIGVRYLYRPYWYCGPLVHEIRVTQTTEADGRAIRRMPQAATMYREYVVTSKTQDAPGDPGPVAESADILRSMLGPMNGGFGPR